MGNWCSCLSPKAETLPVIKDKYLTKPRSLKDNPNLESQVYLWISNLDVLARAQKMTQTKFGLKIQAPSNIMLSNKEVEKIRDDWTASDQVRLIMNPPFNEVSRITDNLYLSGVAGLTTDNVSKFNISFIVNVTYEMPLVTRTNLVSVRVPVDDDLDEDIYFFMDDVSDIIHRASIEGLRSIVHCVAGASRSATVVIVKYQDLSLKEAFCYLHACRKCVRPNMGFFRELIRFEKRVRKKASVTMVDYSINGGNVRVPNFYKKEFPELLQVETQKQLRSSCGSAVRDCNSSQVYSTSKGQLLNYKTMLTPGVKRQKVYLKEALEEINQIRNRSSHSKFS